MKRFALILGASSGFGAASAIRLAKEGLHIAGVHLDRRAGVDQVERIKSEITAAGVEARFFNLNAANPDKRAEIVAALKEQSAFIKVLLHSLAFGALQPYTGPDAVAGNQLEMTLDVMAHSLVYWVQELDRAGLLGAGTQIYGITSAGGQRVLPSYGPVSAAKAALESHIRQLAVELAPRGIIANALCPGTTNSPAARKIPAWDELSARCLAKNPQGRLTTPADVAEWLALFSRSDNSWMTGNIIRLDGGETLVE